MVPTDTPTPTGTPDPGTVVQVVQLAPDEWQFIALAIVLVVFSIGVLVAVKL